MKQTKNGISYAPDRVAIEELRAVQQVRFLTDNTFVVRFDRNDLQFKAGQFLAVGIKGFLQQREYSIYSGENDDYLEILVREVIDGNVSQQLKNVQVGQELLISGPLGINTINVEDINSKRFVFVASGTGISPFHSIVASYSTIDYTIVHGVRYIAEAYDRDDYDSKRYVLCASGEKGGNYYGRVTGFMNDFEVYPNMIFYLSGNSAMIYEVFDILRRKGVADENIHTEVYF